jgi:AcrR family transcriptional regulator
LRGVPRKSESAEPRLDREDWIRAAMVALAEEGVRAVAVEPLARRLGVTKGSFYWHFANREALWSALLERWEQLGVDAVRDDVFTGVEPGEVLTRLLSRVFDIGSAERRLVLRLEVVLVGLAEHDAEVMAVYRRIMKRRLEHSVSLFRALGLERREAEERGFLTFASLLGVYPALLAGVIPGEARTAFARAMAALLAPTPGTAGVAVRRRASGGGAKRGRRTRAAKT